MRRRCVSKKGTLPRDARDLRIVGNSASGGGRTIGEQIPTEVSKATQPASPFVCHCVCSAGVDEGHRGLASEVCAWRQNWSPDKTGSPLGGTRKHPRAGLSPRSSPGAQERGRAPGSGCLRGAAPPPMSMLGVPAGEPEGSSSSSHVIALHPTLETRGETARSLPARPQLWPACPHAGARDVPGAHCWTAQWPRAPIGEQAAPITAPQVPFPSRLSLVLGTPSGGGSQFQPRDPGCPGVPRPPLGPIMGHLGPFAPRPPQEVPPAELCIFCRSSGLTRKREWGAGPP